LCHDQPGKHLRDAIVFVSRKTLPRGISGFYLVAEISAATTITKLMQLRSNDSLWRSSCAERSKRIYITVSTNMPYVNHMVCSRELAYACACTASIPREIITRACSSCVEKTWSHEFKGNLDSSSQIPGMLQLINIALASASPLREAQ